PLARCTPTHPPATGRAATTVAVQTTAEKCRRPRSSRAKRATQRRRVGTAKRPSSSPSDHPDPGLEALDDGIRGLRRISGAGRDTRLDTPVDPRCASTWCASWATVGAEKKLRMEIDVAKDA